MVMFYIRYLKSKSVEEEEIRTSEAGSVHPYSPDVEGELPVEDQKIRMDDKVDVEEVAISV
jgi:hypothetical protein